MSNLTKLLLLLHVIAISSFVGPVKRLVAHRLVSSDLFSLADGGEVGQGPNFIERSFPLNDNENVDPKKVDDYNLGIDGVQFQVGQLSKRMYDAITSRSSLNTADPEIQRALKICTMDFTAKEAVKAALTTNGLELVLNEEEQDVEMWGSVDSIRLLDSQDTRKLSQTEMYDSWEDCVDQWTPGQPFHFVVRNVPAKMRELTLDELLQALDPDGSLRGQAKDAGMAMPDEPMNSLDALANENVRRTEMAPREASEEPFSGLDKRGYRVLSALDLTEKYSTEAVIMHVMDAFVNHGCLLVELSSSQAERVSVMWKSAQEFFQRSDKESIGGMATVEETGSQHAKVGYACYDEGDMEFLETRWDRQGNLLPEEARKMIDIESMRDTFDIVADIARSVTTIAVAASTTESGALGLNEAFAAATLLSDELLDARLPLQSQITNSEGHVSMSPHRLCRYSNEKQGTNVTTREVFGAHTDSTFITAIPVAEVAGLEVFDEDQGCWYQPELCAKQHSQEQHPNDNLPWYARYVVLMPGELLQVATRNEVLASVHRVVATKGRPVRYSAPILLRGRSGTQFDVDRYLGDCMDDPIIKQCDGMSIEQIHDAMQPTSFQ